MNKLAVAVIGGLAVGFLAGLMVAPEKGSDLRKKISDAAGDLVEKLVDIFTATANDLAGSGSGDISVKPEEILG
jgi:gas vesicle protein